MLPTVVYGRIYKNGDNGKTLGSAVAAGLVDKDAAALVPLRIRRLPVFCRPVVNTNGVDTRT